MPAMPTTLPSLLISIPDGVIDLGWGHPSAAMAAAARQFVELGIPAFSPCTYTAQWQGDDLAGGMQPKNGWYKLDLAFLKGCRAMIVFMLPGVADSAGVRMELEYAKAHGIPLYRLEQDDIIPAA